MPKISDYELEHSIDEEVTFEKVRRKKLNKEVKHIKKNHREKKID